MGQNYGEVKLDAVHHSVHKGESFVASQKTAVNALDIASPLTFLLTTSNDKLWTHLSILADLGAQGVIEIFEDDGDTDHFSVADGDAVVPVNRNRNSSKTSGMTVKSGVTVTNATDDVLIYSETIAALLGSGKTDRKEFVLKQNTSYLIRLSTYADDNEGSIVLDWYEKRIY